MKKVTLPTSLIQELTLSEVKQLENCSIMRIRSNESDFVYEFDPGVVLTLSEVKQLEN